MIRTHFHGRITKDVELKTANSGKELTNFTVAVDRDYKDSDGNRPTDFVPCTAFGKSAVFLQQYFHKGDGVIIHGAWESRKYVDKDGNNRTAWEVKVRNIEFPPGKGKGSSDTSSAFMDEVDAYDGELPFG